MRLGAKPTAGLWCFLSGQSCTGRHVVNSLFLCVFLSGYLLDFRLWMGLCTTWEEYVVNDNDDDGF